MAVGTCAITATQPGDATHAAATPVARSFAITTSDTTEPDGDPEPEPEPGPEGEPDPQPDPEPEPDPGPDPVPDPDPAPDGGVDADLLPPAAAPELESPSQEQPPASTPPRRPVVSRTPTDTTTSESTPSIDGADEEDELAAPAADGSLEGVVWFDRNGNGVLDGREWVLPGVTVTASPTTKAAGVRTATTDATGGYRFAHLAAGTYTVTASADIDGFDRTSDTDGALDWLVSVPVRNDDTGIADFAGLGRGTLFGTMFETGSRMGLAFADVACTWGGFDDVLGTTDDVAFTVTADADGAFDLRGVPYGEFTCGGTDSTGRTSAMVAAGVWSAEPVEAPLPVPTAATSPSGTLPITGGGTRDLTIVGLASVGVGAVLVRRGRRHQTS